MRWDAAGIIASGRETAGGFILAGTKLFVPDAHLSDALVVAVRTRDGSTMEDGVSLFLMPKDTPGLTITLLPTIDETRKLCEVRLDNAAVPPETLLGEKHGAWPALSRVLDRATVALSGEMCGGAQRMLDMTTDYAKIGIPFGKPIGSYQGVKHRAADMLVDVENAKSLTYYAAWAIDESLAEAPLAVSMAKAYASAPTARLPAPASNCMAASASPGSTTCSYISSVPRPPRSHLGDATWHRERVARLMTV